MVASHTDSVNGGYRLFIDGGFALLLGGAWFAVSNGLVAAELLFLLPLALMVGVMLDYVLRLCCNERALGIAAMAVFFYMALIFSIAVPFSEQRSAKDLGGMLTVQEAREVGLYGRYPTSAVFYSDSKIVKLMHNSEVAGYVPKDFSWTSKNVMPYATLEANPYDVVVVSMGSYKSFMKQSNASWQVVDEDGQWLLLKLHRLN